MYGMPGRGGIKARACPPPPSPTRSPSQLPHPAAGTARPRPPPPLPHPRSPSLVRAPWPSFCVAAPRGVGGALPVALSLRVGDMGRGGAAAATPAHAPAVPPPLSGGRRGRAHAPPCPPAPPHTHPRRPHTAAPRLPPVPRHPLAVRCPPSFRPPTYRGEGGWRPREHDGRRPAARTACGLAGCRRLTMARAAAAAAAVPVFRGTLREGRGREDGREGRTEGGGGGGRPLRASSPPSRLPPSAASSAVVGGSAPPPAGTEVGRGGGAVAVVSRGGGA